MVERSGERPSAEKKRRTWEMETSISNMRPLESTYKCKFIASIVKWNRKHWNCKEGGEIPNRSQKGEVNFVVKQRRHILRTPQIANDRSGKNLSSPKKGLTRKGVITTMTQLRKKVASNRMTKWKSGDTVREWRKMGQIKTKGGVRKTLKDDDPVAVLFQESWVKETPGLT